MNSILFQFVHGNVLFAGLALAVASAVFPARRDFSRYPVAGMSARIGLIPARDRPTAMFELPLPPLPNGIGRAQRELSKEFGVLLIRKKVLAGVPAAPGATLDGAHLSAKGHRLLAGRVAGLLPAGGTPTPRLEQTPPRSGLRLHLDASCKGALELDERGRVRVWRDTTRRRHDFRQSDPRRRPRTAAGPSGAAVVAFDGYSSFLAAPPLLPADGKRWTLVVVWRPKAAVGVQSVFEQADSPLTPNRRAALLAVGKRYGFNGESNDCHSLAPFHAGRWRLTCMLVDNTRGANVQILDNGALYRGATPYPERLSPGTSGCTIGRKLARDAEYFHGDIAEILVYARILLPGERRRLLWRLDRKWKTDSLGWFRTPEGAVACFNFDGDTFEGWQVYGTAFGPGPARGTLPHQMPVTGFLGSGLANSYHGGDGAAGRLVSLPVLIERPWIRFLVGGGGYPGKTCIRLSVGRTVRRSATGFNRSPGGSERLRWREWDVHDLVGRIATFEIVDRATGGWGHICVDHIIQCTRRLPVMKTRSKSFTAEKKLLNLPVRTGADKRRMRLFVDGTPWDEFDIELTGDPQFWVFADISRFHGRRITVEAELPDGDSALDLVHQSDRIADGDDLYREPLRPQFHFSSRRGWNNDPNGLVYHAGEYHLFYQHNPYGWAWGNMHWGHAVSPDLIHWKELPVAIYPHRYGDWVFSGSAVVDVENTAGFKQGDEDVIVAAFTSTARGECIAYSRDRGRTFTEYEGNPVVKHRGRDPKVIWYGPGRYWVMAVYDEQGPRDKPDRGIAFYTSPDLKNWTRRSRISGYYECPEIFELPVVGRSGEKWWIVYGANGDYSVGTFDGGTFVPETDKQKFSYGNCFYASQTFNNIPDSDGRRIQIAWGRVNMPQMPFNQMMLFPVELTLHATSAGLRLFARPVREIENLHAREWSVADRTVYPGAPLASSIDPELLHARVTVDPGDARELRMIVRNEPVVWDMAAGVLRCRDCTAPLASAPGMAFELLVDRMSIEIFADGGRVYMPVGVALAHPAAAPPPMENTSSFRIEADGGPARIRSCQVWALHSIW